MKSFTLPAPERFDLWQTIYSHGWCVLPPFEVENNQPWLRRTERLFSGRIVTMVVRNGAEGRLKIEIEGSAGKRSMISAAERSGMKKTVAACLRLDEDYEPFYAETRKQAGFDWIERRKAGRLLRSPTVFEDAVKMICTTNCSWSLTEVIVKNLCESLGDSGPAGKRTFPSPEALAGTTESFLRKHVRAGYRAPYLLELGELVASGKLDMESWRTSTLPAGELFAEVRSVKGIGPYAAGNILKLLGRYDYLALDSWCRAKFKELHGKRKVSDKTIEQYYRRFGQWRGLFLWLDLTKHWYDKKFPI